MINVVAQRGEVEAYVMELIADKVSDVAETLETQYNLKTCAAGSTCIVIENSSVWMLGNDGHWHEL